MGSGRIPADDAETSTVCDRARGSESGSSAPATAGKPGTACCAPTGKISANPEEVGSAADGELASEDPRASEDTGVPRDTTSRLPIVDRFCWTPLAAICVFESGCMLQACRSLCALRAARLDARRR